MEQVNYYSTSFQDKKTISALKKEIAGLKGELAKERQAPKTAPMALNYEAILSACERLSAQDKLKLATALNQAATTNHA